MRRALLTIMAVIALSLFSRGLPDSSKDCDAEPLEVPLPSFESDGIDLSDPHLRLVQKSAVAKSISISESNMSISKSVSTMNSLMNSTMNNFHVDVDLKTVFSQQYELMKNLSIDSPAIKELEEAIQQVIDHIKQVVPENQRLINEKVTALSSGNCTGELDQGTEYGYAGIIGDAVNEEANKAQAMKHAMVVNVTVNFGTDESLFKALADAGKSQIDGALQAYQTVHTEWVTANIDLNNARQDRLNEIKAKKETCLCGIYAEYKSAVSQAIAAIPVTRQDLKHMQMVQCAVAKWKENVKEADAISACSVQDVDTAAFNVDTKAGEVSTIIDGLPCQASR